MCLKNLYNSNLSALFVNIDELTKKKDFKFNFFITGTAISNWHFRLSSNVRHKSFFFKALFWHLYIKSYGVRNLSGPINLISLSNCLALIEP